MTDTTAPDLVSVPEVAAITGLTEATIRTYVKRGSIVAPLPVAGGGVLVWERAAVQEWDEQRRAKPRRPQEVDTPSPQQMTADAIARIYAEAGSDGLLAAHHGEHLSVWMPVGTFGERVGGEWWPWDGTGHVSAGGTVTDVTTLDGFCAAVDRAVDWWRRAGLT
jgi:predicted DNA-binding transcriptional regulator AlpA